MVVVIVVVVAVVVVLFYARGGKAGQGRQKRLEKYKGSLNERRGTKK